MGNFKPRVALRLVQPGQTAVRRSEDCRYIEELYTHYREALRGHVSRMVPGGQQEAESLLQDIYVKLLRLQDLTPLRENPRAYLYTIATNLVRDSLRSHLRRKGDQHESYEDAEHASVDPGPCGSVEWQQSLRYLKQALLQLKPVTRKVFLLSRFEEMTYPEIAAALSISTRSVERHMSTALRHVQQELNELL